ncbi:hypothetical protein [Gloeobacter violaceus]|uniref:Gsl0249 protein n=1 Tax=Gloeobacter violaceus (strain ATCC 29082 / PCC 7421) TaxID=251221 RepID=Q7NP09_GLOVI|nr:hypothetical protein [Gloeobacter violaceus]BAC88190.1 gsl0249 [Gloeobacter violaceus PCC 7421]
MHFYRKFHWAAAALLLSGAPAFGQNLPLVDLQAEAACAQKPSPLEREARQLRLQAIVAYEQGEREQAFGALTQRRALQQGLHQERSACRGR